MMIQRMFGLFGKLEEKLNEKNIIIHYDINYYSNAIWLQ